MKDDCECICSNTKIDKLVNLDKIHDSLADAVVYAKTQHTGNLWDYFTSYILPALNQEDAVVRCKYCAFHKDFTDPTGYKSLVCMKSNTRKKPDAYCSDGRREL